MSSSVWASIIQFTCLETEQKKNDEGIYSLLFFFKLSYLSSPVFGLG